MLPRNGYELMKARRAGMRPLGAVLVTDDKTPRADCQLVITPGMDYEFAMLENLDVLLILDTYTLRWQFKPYRRWMDLTIRDIQQHARNLFVMSGELAWGKQ